LVAERDDLFGRADQCRGVAVGARELCDLGPEPLVDATSLIGQGKQPARACGGVSSRPETLMSSPTAMVTGSADEGMAGFRVGLQCL